MNNWLIPYVQSQILNNYYTCVLLLEKMVKEGLVLDKPINVYSHMEMKEIAKREWERIIDTVEEEQILHDPTDKLYFCPDCGPSAGHHPNCPICGRRPKLMAGVLEIPDATRSEREHRVDPDRATEAPSEEQKPT